MKQKYLLKLLMFLCLSFILSSGWAQNQSTAISSASVRQELPPTIYSPPIDMVSGKYYKLDNIKAIDVNDKHTKAEMLNIQKEAESELEVMDMLIDWDQKMLYKVWKDTQQKPIELSFKITNKTIEITNCEACQMQRFLIKEQSEKRLILELQPEDEGQFFVFILTLIK